LLVAPEEQLDVINKFVIQGLEKVHAPDSAQLGAWKGLFAEALAARLSPP